MNLASLERIRKEYAERVVLDGVSFGVDDGDRVGVIGLNGSGKSTLLRILAGVEAPDDGRVTHGSSVRTHYLAQEPTLPDEATPFEVVIGIGATEADAPAEAGVVRAFEAAQAAVRDAPEDPAALERLEAATQEMDAAGAWSLERRARATLDRLGLGGVQQRVGTMSGGQRKRVALARALVSPAELLVLDEPTNHLDVDVIEWLEGELRGRTGALVLVTHDRYLLDRLVTRVIEVERGRIHTNHGSYADYLEARAERQAQAEREERKRQNLARVELEWLRRGPKARGTKAKHRVEKAHELLESRVDTEQPELVVNLPARRIGSKVVDLHNAGKRYGDQWVVSDVDLRLQPRDRIGLVGPNGSGKTTLLGLVAGRLMPDAGSVRMGDTVHVGWFGQEPEQLPPRTRVLSAVQEIVRETNTAGLVGAERGRSEGIRLTAGDLLERFLFTSAQQKAYVEDLSGGERRRLELLRVLADAPNLLLLDEPTNDLDLDTLSVLESFLDGWPGALVAASHDRYFLDRVCGDVWSLDPPEPGGPGQLRHHPGGWPAYRDWRAQSDRRAQADSEHRAGGENGRRQSSGDGGGRGRKLTYNEQRERAQLAERVGELEERRAALTDALEHTTDPDELSRLGRELADVEAELDAAGTRWLELEMVADERSANR
ncbi:ABC transporter ATP-binding protein [Egibacter rhizosphaerae]|uniref:ABC transporter ATP-binding protein n=1 Tax=Egibacter rhizosphaerae TaxID=1670831 RepID=A0A411YH98_9ACTN|nr:ABC-F family ATP-binding cassette domain-containing protein [Egibacter rhizosphaerae]QBI20634.1 ABC transporter ATP-binding protein [Egibacter rhizosphaerae]